MRLSSDLTPSIEGTGDDHTGCSPIPEMGCNRCRAIRFVGLTLPYLGFPIIGKERTLTASRRFRWQRWPPPETEATLNIPSGPVFGVRFNVTGGLRPGGCGPESVRTDAPGPASTGEWVGRKDRVEADQRLGLSQEALRLKIICPTRFLHRLAQPAQGRTGVLGLSPAVLGHGQKRQVRWVGAVIRDRVQLMERVSASPPPPGLAHAVLGYPRV